MLFNERNMVKVLRCVLSGKCVIVTGDPGSRTWWRLDFVEERRYWVQGSFAKSFTAK
jgi:hypothetical protein